MAAEEFTEITEEFYPETMALVFKTGMERILISSIY